MSSNLYNASTKVAGNISRDHQEAGDCSSIQQYYSCFRVIADVSKIIVPQERVRAVRNRAAQRQFARMFLNPDAYGDNKTWISSCILGLDHETLVELYELTKKKRVNVHALSAEHEPLRTKMLSKRMIYIGGLSRGAA